MAADTVIINDYEVLTRANEFKEVSKQIKNSMGNSVPLEINACFSCELYFKYLLNFVQKGKTSLVKNELVKIGHDLKALYNEVDDETKSIISQKMGFDISEHLKEVGCNFVELRYDYEHEEVTYSTDFFYDLMIVLSDICNQ